jgi:hypothetical protein
MGLEEELALPDAKFSNLIIIIIIRGFLFVFVCCTVAVSNCLAFKPAY